MKTGGILLLVMEQSSALMQQGNIIFKWCVGDPRDPGSITLWELSLNYSIRVQS